MRSSERRLLENILKQPTAPFHEQFVQAAIESAARKMELPVQRDRFGNLYVRYRQGSAPPLAFTAHMDHPGFEIVADGERRLAQLLGGVRAECLEGAPVVFHPGADPDGAGRPSKKPPVRGHIIDVESHTVPGGRRPDIRVEVDVDGKVNRGDFGHFDFPGCEIKADQLSSRALDNLLSCALILITLQRLRRRQAKANLLGVFTRAEEVGFVGAGGVLRANLLRASRAIVVLETSKAFGAVQMGSGPVLRVGDRMTCFDPDMDLWLAQRASELAADEPDFRYQRALMTGGACEASLFMLHERSVGALAIPLGNYHNMTEDNSIAPELIHLDDFENGLALLEHLALHPPDPGVRRQRRAALDAVFERLSPRLSSSS